MRSSTQEFQEFYDGGCGPLMCCRWLMTGRDSTAADSPESFVDDTPTAVMDGFPEVSYGGRRKPASNWLIAS